MNIEAMRQHVEAERDRLQEQVLKFPQKLNAAQETVVKEFNRLDEMIRPDVLSELSGTCPACGQKLPGMTPTGEP